MELQNIRLAEKHWKMLTKEGDSPVRENFYVSKINFPSITRHEKPGVNLGGPPPKAKYYLTTDSEQSRATEK